MNIHYFPQPFMIFLLSIYYLLTDQIISLLHNMQCISLNEYKKIEH